MSTTTTTEKENGYVSAHEQAEHLSEEFVEVESATQTDGTILATVTSIERIDGSDYNDHVNEKIRVRTETPLGRRGTHVFDIPEPWTEEFEFVRWVRANGSAAGRLDNLIGEKVPVMDNDLVVPSEPKSLQTRLGEKISENKNDGVFYVSSIITFALLQAFIQGYERMIPAAELEGEALGTFIWNFDWMGVLMVVWNTSATLLILFAAMLLSILLVDGLLFPQNDGD